MKETSLEANEYYSSLKIFFVLFPIDWFQWPFFRSHSKRVLRKFFTDYSSATVNGTQQHPISTIHKAFCIQNSPLPIPFCHPSNQHQLLSVAVPINSFTCPISESYSVSSCGSYTYSIEHFCEDQMTHTLPMWILLWAKFGLRFRLGFQNQFRTGW